MSTAKKPLQQELAACACNNLRKTARVVTQAYDAHLRPTGLRITQFSLLAVLATRHPLPMTHLAETMVMDRTTLTRNLKPLEKQGLIRIAPGADSRVHEISIRAKGRAKLAAAIPQWERAQKTIAESLGERGLEEMLNGLAATRAVFRPE